ncbi:hypothetical protein MXAN_4926 [Sporocytophaga myxococcoides]|uniref:Uncharacterized protein n=1 Tax=Sporocytophaga myxococcoides TaxID=153721 RepID=A0A098LCX9_9BACT|nr:hypothetical protein [Sporocytophaga myxococcoides]GAL84751.1 hypothetical protein MXAN_4926 [Sporocytophaga myxococcoides]
MSNDKPNTKSTESTEQEEATHVQADTDNNTDVILEVPSIKAESVNMDAENLKFSISVKAQLSNFSNIEIGTDIHVEKIKLDINSLEAEALFTAKLKKIETIFIKALESIDKNPDIANCNNNSEGDEE